MLSQTKYGMVEYCRNNIYEHNIDDITFDDISTHPRGIIYIRRANNIPYIYNVSTIINIIEKGNRCDPFTRQPFSLITIERAYLYKRCLDTFPNYTIEKLNTVLLFYKWLKTFIEPNMKEDEKDKIKLEASCFLQTEDLVSIFKSFHGKTSMNNREACVKELKNKPIGTWLLRNSSLQDSKYNKSYVLSIKKDKDKYLHIPIIHKIGEGICFRCKLDRGQSVDCPFLYKKIYPTIIQLLEDTVMNVESDFYCEYTNLVNYFISNIYKKDCSYVKKEKGARFQQLLSCTA